MRISLRVIIGSCLILLLFFGTPFGMASSATASNSTIALSRIHSGLVAGNPFNSTITQQQLEESSGQWSFGGHFGATSLTQTNANAWTYVTNTSQQNVNVRYNEDQQGLHIGLQGLSQGNSEDNTYTGFYALLSNPNAELFHATITSNNQLITQGDLQVGLYVQSSSKNNINYVTCGAYTGQNGTSWQVIHATGLTEANNFDYLWSDNASSQPTTRDCTLITNGTNYLAVFLDGSLVYQKDDLSLNMKGPFITTLEIETTDYNEMLSGTWSNFYSTTGSNITITNIPSGSTKASIVSQNGTVLSSTPVVNHKAIFNVAKYELPIIGSVKTYYANGTVTSSTGNNAVSLYAGDTFSGNGSIGDSSIALVFTPPFVYLFAIPVGLVIAVFAAKTSKKNSVKQS